MKVKYVLLSLMMVCTYNIGTTHILNSAYVDTPLAYCMDRLQYLVLYDLCPTYGDYTSEEVYQMALPQESTVKKSEYKKTIIEKCCSKPCTISELLSIC